MSRWRKLLTVSLPAALIAVVFAQTAIEVWVRSRWDPRRGQPGFFLSDPVRGQRLAANYDGWFAGVPVHTNSLELRDPREYALEKRPNTFRILVLGDSVTFGHGSLYETTYPYLLEQRLKRWRPEIDWQVWNAAVPGYNTSQELAHLLEVGDRFRPDLVIVGFFVNDLTDNAPVPHPGRATVAVYRLLSYARRHLYSLELYKQVYLSARWRLGGSDEYRLRMEHLGTEEGLLARTSDAGVLREQQLTEYTRLSDEQVASNRCPGGMKPGADLIPAMQRQPGYHDWLAAVRELQRLDSTGRFRVVFFVNHAPPICPDGDYYYDGAKAMHEFFLAVLSEGTPAVSCYDAFLHTVPSQMPAADGHSLGNANAVKADTLFGFLRARMLPDLLSAAAVGRR